MDLVIHGNQLLKKNRPREALAAYIEAVRAGDESASVYHQIGMCHEALGDGIKAYLAFKEAVDRAQGRGHSADTIQTFDQALQRHQSLWRQARGLPLADVLNAPPVEVRIERGFRMDRYLFLELPPRGVAACQSFRGVRDFMDGAMRAYDEGDEDLALDILHVAVNHANAHKAKSSALYLAARLLAGRGDLEKAAQYLDWTLELDPDDTRAADIRGQLRLHLGH